MGPNRRGEDGCMRDVCVCMGVCVCLAEQRGHRRGGGVL